MRHPFSVIASCLAILVVASSISADSPKLTTLLIDGQNNHKWQETSPLITAVLEATGRFDVDVVTTPPAGGDMSAFRPNFADYDVVVSNYNGQSWPAATQQSFVQYVRDGGGFVCVHAANNSFPDWPEYNQMIGLGGWGGRTEKDGPYVRWNDGKFHRDTTAGPGGSHGNRHPFEVIVRDVTHPITRGIPSTWIQAEDELYSQLRGPATNMQVLATAFADKKLGGPRSTGQHEPILMVIEFGKGRVFHTTLGHDAKSISGTGFQITLQRGTQWAATGNVTLPSVTAAQLSSELPVMRHPLKLKTPVGGKADFNSVPDISSHGWVTLFDGKSLDGWTQKNGTAKYSIDEGAILGVTETGSPNSFLCSDKDYADFELTFEVKVHDQLNSGVQIRSKSLADYQNGRVHGPQVEIESGPAEAGYVYGEATGRGWLSPHQPKTDAIKNGQWNRFIIRAVGPRIQTWINGTKIEDIYDPTSYQEGFFGLQVHGIRDKKGPFDVRWRDIRIRKM